MHAATNHDDWLYPITRFTFGVPGRLAWGLKLVGRDFCPPDGPLLVAANHASYLDPFYLTGRLPRPIRWLVNETWFHKSPRWRSFFEAHGCLAVSKGEPEETLDRILGTLAAGEAVGIFPEGRLSPDGRPGRVRAGLGWMAARSGAPVLPCGIQGSFEVLPKGHAWPRTGRVTIRLGAPMRYPDGPVAAPDPRDAARFSGEVMGRIRELFETR